MLTLVDGALELVLIVKLADDAPPGTVTLEGTVATEVLLLDSATTAPPDGAGPLSPTVPWLVPPPVTEVGESVSEPNAATV
jgi:hypothetical protein